MSDLARLKKHADRFGIDGVMETAVELDLYMDELVELQEYVDAIVAKDRWAPKKKLSAAVRVRRLLGLPDEEEE